jgi:hypothetical protein
MKININFYIIVLILLLNPVAIYCDSNFNDSPLSFDDNEIPFNTITSYVFRGDDYFYERSFKYLRQTYKTIKIPELSRFFIYVEGVYNDSDTPSFFQSKTVELDPYAFNCDFGVGGSLGNFIYNYSLSLRSYIYFDYRKKNDDEDISFTGELTSDIYSLTFGYNNYFFSPYISINQLTSQNEHEGTNLNKLPIEYQNIYNMRNLEVESRLEEIGFKEKTQYSVSIMVFSEKYNSSFLFAPGYYKIAPLFNTATVCNKDIMKFSQYKLDITSLSKQIFNKKLLPFISYSFLINYSKPWFTNFSNIISEVKFEKKWVNDKTPSIEPFSIAAMFMYNHTENNLDIIKLSCKIMYFIFFEYEYNNKNIFIPTEDYLYRGTFRLIVGTTAIFE